MSSSRDTLRDQHRDEHRSMHRLFLGGAASAIAFAFHETADRELAWSLLPVLVAIIAWSSSFVAGIWASRNIQVAFKANLSMLDAATARDAALHNEATVLFAKSQRRAWIWQETQLWTLLAGAILYLGGHIWHITEASGRDLGRLTASHVKP